MDAPALEHVEYVRLRPYKVNGEVQCGEQKSFISVRIYRCHICALGI